MIGNITLRFQTAESAEERRGWENVLDALAFLSGSIKMKNNKGKIWN